MLRLEAIKEAGGRPYGDAGSARRSRGFLVGNRFEAETIFSSVVVKDEYQIREQQFRPNDVIIDIGANIGAFSYLCHLQGSRAIYSYEPGERNFGNPATEPQPVPGGSAVLQKAVWRSDADAAPGTGLLSGADGENTGAHSVLAAGLRIDFADQQVGGSVDEARWVASVPLDEILRGFEGIKLLKLDCEGSEFPILLTSQELGRVERIVGEDAMNMSGK